MARLLTGSLNREFSFGKVKRMPLIEFSLCFLKKKLTNGVLTAGGLS